MRLVIWMLNQSLEVFIKKELQKPSQEKFRIKKLIKKKGDKLRTLNGKDTTILLIIGSIEKTLNKNESVLS